MIRDPGLEAVNFLFDQLQIDEQWSEREAQGFTWWPSRFAQTVTAGRERRHDESSVHVCLVSVTSDLVTGVPDIEAAEFAANEFNQTAGMSAMRVDREARTMELVSYVVVHQEVAETYGRLLVLAAMAQIAEADLWRIRLAEAIGATINDSGPRAGVFRDAPDEMLGALSELPSMGKAGTHLTPTDFYTCSFPPENVVGGGRAWVMATPQPDSVTIEVPFQHSTPAIYLADSQSHLEVGTALIVLQSVGDDVVGLAAELAPSAFDQRVRRYGPGLGIHLSIPLDLDDNEAIQTAAELNRFELAQDDMAFLGGAWHSSVPRTLNFSGYLPAILFGPLTAEERAALLMNIAFTQAIRVRFAGDHLNSRGDGAHDSVGPAPIFGFSQNTAEGLIRRGESHHVEFKSSARWDYREQRKNRTLEDVIVKTIAGFMNADGGTLLIGVDDGGDVLGIEPDVALVKPQNTDGLENWLVSSLLKRRLGAAALAHVAVSFEPVDGLDLCRVDVKQSREPVVADYGPDDSRFFVRTGNSTNQLDEEADVYIRRHFVAQKAPSDQDSPSPELVLAAALSSLTSDTAALIASQVEDALRAQARELQLDASRKASAMLASALAVLSEAAHDEGASAPPSSPASQDFFDRVAFGAGELGRQGVAGARTVIDRALPAFEDGIRRYEADPQALVHHCLAWFLLLLLDGPGKLSLTEPDFRSLAAVYAPPPGVSIFLTQHTE
jgi:hypothetical protein